MKKLALVVVDVLNDFVTGAIGCDNAKAVIQPLVTLTEEARKHNIPVIYTNDAHIEGIDKELSLWGDHALEGSEGAQVVPELTPQKGDYLVPKRRYSGFFQTHMDLLLRELGVDTLIVTGLYVHLCCRMTCADAYNLGYGLIIPRETMAAFPNDDYEAGLTYLKECFGAEICSLEEAIDIVRG